MKLAFGVPWASPFFYTKTVDSIMNLQAPSGVQTRFFRGEGWCPARRHIDLCEKALDWGADFILILGADQTYPEDLLWRLISHNLPVVAAMVPSRGWIEWVDMKPFQPMAWRFKPTNRGGEFKEFRGTKQDMEMLECLQRHTGLQQADFIGSGVLMFHRDVLLALEKPWFYERVKVEDQSRTACMDTTFTFRLQREAGERLMVDTDIDIGHLHIFEIDESFQDRFMDWKTSPEIGDQTIIEREKNG